MKTRRCLRYLCDYCKKSGCSKSAMVHHEARCFRNPTRKCPVCERQWPIAELAPAMEALVDVDDSNEDALIKAISEEVESCPACTLSAILQSEIPTHDVEYHGWDGDVTHSKERHWIKWDYKKARDAYNAEKRAEEAALVAPREPAF